VERINVTVIQDDVHPRGGENAGTRKHDAFTQEPTIVHARWNHVTILTRGGIARGIVNHEQGHGTRWILNKQDALLIFNANGRQGIARTTEPARDVIGIEIRR